MNCKKPASRCKAIAKSGEPCRAAATQGGLCFFHGNPHKASELGRIGGRKNRGSIGRSTDCLPKLDSVISVRDLLARLIPEVYAGAIPPKVAMAMMTLLNLQLRAMEKTDIEHRIGELEQQLRTLKLMMQLRDFDTASESQSTEI